MQAVNNMLYTSAYTTIDFVIFFGRRITNASGQASAYGLFDISKTISKIIKYMATFKFSSPECKKLKEHLDCFNKIYCAFTAIPMFISKTEEACEAIDNLREHVRCDNNFNWDELRICAEKIGYSVKSFFDLISSFTNYFDPFGLSKLTPLKYINGGLDIFDDAASAWNDIFKLRESWSSQDLVDASHQIERKAGQMKIIKQGWDLGKDITSLALSIIGLLALTTSLAVPFYVVPALGLTCVAFSLFSKYAAYYQNNPRCNSAWAA